MIQLDWDNAQKTIIRYTFLHPWTWEEYYATNANRDTMFSATHHVIDIILDFSEGERIPPQAMMHFPKAASWDNPRRGVVIILGLNSTLRALANIMIRVYPQAALKAPRPAKDLDEARQIIGNIRLEREKNISSL